MFAGELVGFSVSVSFRLNGFSVLGEPEGTLESHFESTNNSLAGITGPAPPIGLKIGLTMRKNPVWDSLNETHPDDQPGDNPHSSVPYSL